MGFIRVRSKNGALHEFDISEQAYRARPSVYKVIDSKPVEKARPTKYVEKRPVVVKKEGVEDDS